MWPLCAVALIALLSSLYLIAPSPWQRSSTAGDGQLTRPTPRAEFGTYNASAAAHLVADWALAVGDAAGGPFIIVDKVGAAIYVFDADGRLRGSAPVLLGSAVGDDTVAGIGEKPIDKVLPQERTTPAGRFVGEPGRNARGEDVIWVDYDAAVSMHRVITFNPAERRLERLSTPTVDDNRISYGCINIPADFYDAHVRPAYAERNAVVYVLPEVKSLTDVFAIGGAARAALRATSTQVGAERPSARQSAHTSVAAGGAQS